MDNFIHKNLEDFQDNEVNEANEWVKQQNTIQKLKEKVNRLEREICFLRSDNHTAEKRLNQSQQKLITALLQRKKFKEEIASFRKHYQPCWCTKSEKIGTCGDCQNTGWIKINR